jgi:hypothetical protein
VTTALATPQLTAEDRCDRCGAQAYARVVLPSGGELLFCGHHMRAHREHLTSIAAQVHDETSRLADVPGTAAADER